MLRVYRLTSSSAVTAVGQASTTIVNKGRIKQISAICSPGQCTAGGNISAEVALNNSNNGNATVASLQSTDNLLHRVGVTLANALAPNSISSVIQLNRPVTPGDVLCINVIATGTFAAAFHMFDVFVEE